MTGEKHAQAGMGMTTGVTAATEISHDAIEVRMPDGVVLYTRCWTPTDREVRAVLVISHGLGEHSGRYMPFVEYVVPRGAAVYAQDHRGFGRSGGQRGHVDRRGRYVEELRPLVERARVAHPGLPVVLVGHSMGGVIALLFALRYPGLLSAAVFSAPALVLGRRVPAVQRLGARMLSRLAPTVSTVQKIDPAVLTGDAAIVAATAADPLRHPKVTVRLFAEMLDDGPREVLARAAELRVPYLILHGSDDALVNPSGTRLFYERATTPRRALKLYPGLRHEAFNEVGHDAVFADIVTWLSGEGIALAPPR